MTTHSIIFTADEVRATLDGTMTRVMREVKLPHFQDIELSDSEWIFRNKRDCWVDVTTETLISKYCPFGTVGDHLIVKETWMPDELPDGKDGVWYKADNVFKPIENTIEASEAWGEAYWSARYTGKPSWISPVTMPRWASRITLEITGISVVQVDKWMWKIEYRRME